MENDSSANPIIPQRQGRVSVRVDEEVIEKFDLLADGRGGRSAYLRQLINGAIESAGNKKPSVLGNEKSIKRIAPGFNEAELAVISYQAEKSSTDATNWVRQLVRRWCNLKGHVERPLMERLISVRQELRRIGRNVNQIARAANNMALTDTSNDLTSELEKLHLLRQDVMTQFEILDGAMQADMDYWKVPAE